MKDFRRSALLLLVGTLFLLLVAWVGMKWIQHGGNTESLLLEGQQALEKWTGKLAPTLDKARQLFQRVGDAVGPKAEELVKPIQGFFGKLPGGQ